MSFNLGMTHQKISKHYQIKITTPFWCSTYLVNLEKNLIEVIGRLSLSPLCSTDLTNMKEIANEEAAHVNKFFFALV